MNTEIYEVQVIDSASGIEPLEWTLRRARDLAPVGFGYSKTFDDARRDAMAAAEALRARDTTEWIEV